MIRERRGHAPRAGSLDPQRTRGRRRLARFVLLEGRVPTAAPAHPAVLLLARPGPENDELFADLDRREDLCLLRVATAAAAARAIEEMPVALLVACPETAAASIDAAVASLQRARPGAPVLALRARRAPEHAAWKDRGVAVLRLPLLPGVLSRTIDVVLGMRGGRSVRKEGR